MPASLLLTNYYFPHAMSLWAVLFSCCSQALRGLHAFVQVEVFIEVILSVQTCGCIEVGIEGHLLRGADNFVWCRTAAVAVSCYTAACILQENVL